MRAAFFYCLSAVLLGCSSSDPSSVAGSSGSVSTADAGAEAGTGAEPRFLPIGKCVAEKASADADGKIPWRAIVQLPDGSSCATYSLQSTDASTLAAFQTMVPDAKTVCDIVQAGSSELTDGTCKLEMVPRWCYVTGAQANGCSQTVLLSAAFAGFGSDVTSWKFFAVIP